MAALELTSQIHIQGDRQMRELTFRELDAVSGGGFAGWVLRAWKKWINKESDDVVNSLDDLNQYAKGNHDTYEES